MGGSKAPPVIQIGCITGLEIVNLPLLRMCKIPLICHISILHKTVDNMCLCARGRGDTNDIRHRYKTVL